ncbi:hypothetical protein PVA45_07960 (plasmid) [Entomospira entomophila]|uniref:Uncharacterized protein n=1 Tax=Entomospira entomophila TaxID=2719988 RepID=A0A968GE94_9SPIO|nr:hypothetical protein [Entomospira entomophilus]NIZ41439.1 hypothetical protein [Entomospira entomophilus]WDI36389.1 hypothetical protein PVA45_07960 [Entomospira entomophilus]
MQWIVEHVDLLDIQERTERSPVTAGDRNHASDDEYHRHTEESSLMKETHNYLGIDFLAIL